jgi:hypothetical protein
MFDFGFTICIARISLLLDPIEDNLVVRTSGIDPRTQLGIPELMVVKKKRRAPSSISSKAAFS